VARLLHGRVTSTVLADSMSGSFFLASTQGASGYSGSALVDDGGSIVGIQSQSEHDRFTDATRAAADHAGASASTSAAGRDRASANATGAVATESSDVRELRMRLDSVESAFGKRLQEVAINARSANSWIAPVGGLNRRDVLTRLGLPA
jgi:hypothetical protein